MGALLADNLRRAAHDQHRCGWCGDTIGKGHLYRDARIADNGTVWTWREHLRCSAFISKHLDRFEAEDIYDPRKTYDELVREYGSPHA